ncbi:MAG: hypothetical protein ACI8P2_001705, partial [Candidatus Latescibacterota bacterium]
FGPFHNRMECTDKGVKLLGTMSEFVILSVLY